MTSESTLTTPTAHTKPRQVRRSARWVQWLIVTVAGLLAWILFMLGAVLQREYLVLLFPAGWCVYVAMRQFRQITRDRAGEAR